MTAGISRPLPESDGLGRQLSFDQGRTGRHMAAIKKAGRGTLVGFLHVGFPDVATSLTAMRAASTAHAPTKSANCPLMSVKTPIRTVF